MILNITDLKQKFSLEDYPVTITGDGQKCVMTITGHNFKTGEYLNLTGTTQDGLKLVTRLSPNQLSFVSTSTTTEQGVIKQWDKALTKIIAQVEAEIGSYCHIYFGQSDSASEIHDLKLDGMIYPSRGRLADGDVTQILLSTKNNFTDSTKYITLEPEDYFLYEDRIELCNERSTPYLNNRRAVKITYATQEAPASIVNVAEQMAEFYFRILNDKSINLNSLNSQGEQSVYAKSLPQYIWDALDQFKRITIGEPY